MVPGKRKETKNSMEEKKDIKENINDKSKDKGDDDLMTENDEILDVDVDIDMNEWFSNNLNNFQVGKVVKGEIIAINDDAIYVDIKYKSEGIIPMEEFGNSAKDVKYKVGDSIDVFFENTENKDGRIVLSKRKADHYFAWDKIASAYTNNEPIKGRIVKRVKGGLQIDINGIYAFLPASQVDLTLRQDLDNFTGKELEMKIIKLNRSRNNIVLSRRIILEEKRNHDRDSLLKNLVEGEIRKGIVRNITHFGAFVDLGGMNGLLHITDLSWRRVSHPSEVLHVGQEIEVKILAIDKESGKISLGLKQKTENPWNSIAKKYKVGDKVKGKIVSMTDYGAFVELEEGVEGLVHISEMSWTKRIEHPSEIMGIGDKIDIVILNINKDEEKISLGIKQIQPNPWEKLAQEFPVGLKIKRKIKNIADFGVFVELIEGIDAFIHISDFSWVKHFSRAQEAYKKDDEIEAVVLSIEKESQKISLGIKQLEPNPWEHIPGKYPVGSNINVKVTGFSEFGVLAELEKNVDGLIHFSQIENKENKKIEELFNPGDEITVKILKINIDQHKINLSLKAYMEEQSRKEIKEYIDKQKKEVATIGEIAGNDANSIKTAESK